MGHFSNVPFFRPFFGHFFGPISLCEMGMAVLPGIMPFLARCSFLGVPKNVIFLTFFVFIFGTFEFINVQPEGISKRGQNRGGQNTPFLAKMTHFWALFWPLFTPVRYRPLLHGRFTGIYAIYEHILKYGVPKRTHFGPGGPWRGSPGVTPGGHFWWHVKIDILTFFDVFWHFLKVAFLTPLVILCHFVTHRISLLDVLLRIGIRFVTFLVKIAKMGKMPIFTTFLEGSKNGHFGHFWFVRMHAFAPDSGLPESRSYFMHFFSFCIKMAKMAKMAIFSVFKKVQKCDHLVTFCHFLSFLGPPKMTLFGISRVILESPSGFTRLFFAVFAYLKENLIFSHFWHVPLLGYPDVTGFGQIWPNPGVCWNP